MKKLMSMLLATAMVVGLFAGCTNDATQGGSSDVGSKTNSQDGGNKEKTKLKFWYYHKGEEAKWHEELTKRFNDSQDEYIVESFSVPDKQKYTVAMSSNDSPDIIELTNQDVTSYVANGMLESMDTLIKDVDVDLTPFSKQALEATTIDGKQYGLPWSSIVIQMYYNKDILKSIGYDEPPKTMEELYEMAEKATTLDKDGNIDILGYPLFPLASARQEGVYGFGGRWWNEDGTKATPTDPGIIKSLEANVNFRKKYGMDKVQKFVATGNTNRYTPQDIFFAGKQLFRFDGAWLSTQIKENNPDVSYGVAMVPGTKANPELRGASRYETAGFSIPIQSTQKEGAMKFIDFFTKEENVQDILVAYGNLPALTTLYENEKVLGAHEDMKYFIEALKTENGIQYPKMGEYSKYVSLIEEHLDYVYNGNKTPEEAMKALEQQAKNLK